MNTNSNVYTVIYTTVVVVIVAAVLAFVSQKLGPMQAANEKAETISQILTAAGFGEKEHWAEIGNAETIEFYKENIAFASLVDAEGKDKGQLDCAEAEILSTSQLKAENYRITKSEEFAIPVYAFKNGISVLPVYGAGLWGPVWGYIALKDDCRTIAGAYFDHASETPGLGGKIKDDPAFRAQFAGKTIDFSGDKPFNIVKGGAPEGMSNGIDAITGATMTSKGLDKAINTWLGAYRGQIEVGMFLNAIADGVANVNVKTAKEEK